MAFRIQAEHVNGELVHSFFESQDQFTGLELVEVTDKVPRTPYNDRFWALRYDGEYLYRTNGKLFLFESIEEVTRAVEHEYACWISKRRRRTA